MYLIRKLNLNLVITMDVFILLKILIPADTVRCQTKVHNLSSNYVWGFSMNYKYKGIFAQ